MSESRRSRSERRDGRIIRKESYQQLVKSLLFNCRAITSSDGVDIAAPGFDVGPRHLELDPPELEVFDEDIESEWDNLTISVYPEGNDDSDGKEELANIALTQYLTDDLEFTKDYRLIYGKGLYWVLKENYLYTPIVKTGDAVYHMFENTRLTEERELWQLEQIVDESSC